ncbi:MAG: phenylalanine--tRNA ligase beta subunit-related protein [Pseudomonadota bacterium]
MPLTLSIAELTETFPDFRAAVILATDLNIPAERPEALDPEIARREAACRERHEGAALSEIPGVAAWREAYKKFGIKKTSYRSSVERIVKNVLADRPLARINGFVDAYNAVSLEHVLPVGADDVACIDDTVAFRFSRKDDTFYPLGKEDAENDPPKPGEVVLASGTAVLCRRWNWYQDARSPITENTRAALVTIQSNGFGDPHAAAEDLADLLKHTCGATSTIEIVSAERPEAVFEPVNA